MKYITIVGTRDATKEELQKLKDIAEKYHDKGYTLRSGGAEGADSVINHLENVEIIIPWNGFNGLKHDGKRVFVLDKLPNQTRAKEITIKIHPAPDRLSQGALKLHTRNIYQITGVQDVNRKELSEKVYFIADEVNGKVKGGTRTAVMLARGLNIPTVNIRKRNEPSKRAKLGVKKYTKEPVLLGQIMMTGVICSSSVLLWKRRQPIKDSIRCTETVYELGYIKEFEIPGWETLGNCRVVRIEFCGKTSPEYHPQRVKVYIEPDDERLKRNFLHVGKVVRSNP